MYCTTLKKPKSANDYDIHQMLWCLFPQHQQQQLERPFCFRIIEDEILLLSNIKPTTDSKELVFKENNTYLFECRASMRRTYKDENGKRKQRENCKGDELKDWFKRRFGDAAIVDFVAYKDFAPHIVANPKNQNKMVFAQYVFQGSLTVKNSDEFETIISKGIGQGCAFGFGAMILPQVMK